MQMARKAPCRLLRSPVSKKCLDAITIILVMYFIAQPVGNGMQRCEAAAVRQQLALPNRAEMASAVAAKPSFPVRRNLIKSFSASYGVTFTWPFTMSYTASSSGSSGQEEEPSISWYTTASSGSSSSSSTVSADWRGQQTGSISSPPPSPLPQPSPTSTSYTGSTGISSSSSSSSSSTSSATSSSRPGPCWRSDGNGGGAEYLTVSSKCPNDDFNLAIIEYNTSWTFDNNPTVYGVYFSSGWAVTRGLTENQQIRPRQTDGDSGQYVAILRVKDRKWIAPKAVSFRSTSSRVEDGGSSKGGSSTADIESWFDVSSRKHRVCVLVVESSDRPFPRFRIVVKADGDRVLADSVAAAGEPISKGLAGVYCEDLKHEAVLGYNYIDKDYTQGQLADAYDPSGCKIVVDDCSS